jgi:hypothetical protein
LEARLSEKAEVDYVEKVKTIIRNYGNEIPYKNMFAIVIPEVSLDSLRRLCSHIASVNAASTVISYLKVSEPEQAKRRKLDIIKRGPTIPMLEGFFKNEQEFENVLLEIMEHMHKKIESYATSIASSAISNYTTELIRLFKTVVYYDPRTNSIVHADLGVTFDKMAKEFKEVYGELPSWILNTVSGRCGIRKAPDIRASLIEYIKKYAEKHKSELLADKKLGIDSSYIVESMAKGWPEIPIKPISKSQVESAVRQLSGSYSLEDPDINEIKVSMEDTKIVIERVKALPPPVEELYSIAEIRGINNVTIIATFFEKKESLEKLKSELSEVQAVDFSANVGRGKIELSKVPADVIQSLKLGSFLQNFRKIIPDASLTIHFEEKMKKEKLLEWFKRIGVDEKMLKLKKPGEYG